MAADTASELLLPTRFGPAPALSPLIVREALLDTLMRSYATCRLSALIGPAGAGKSSLLAQWLDVLRRGNRRVAWLSLERSDASCAELLAGIFRASEACGSGFATTLQEAVLAASENSVEIAVHRLAEAINSGQGPEVLLLDQFEAIDASAASALIAGLLKHAVRLHIGIASRARLHLPLGPLRAINAVLELDAADLHFTLDETRIRIAERVPEMYVRLLHTMTDGSPIALQFACQAFTEPSRRPEVISGWLARLHDYYREQVFEHLPATLQAAACRLAAVERFDASLAQAVLGKNADAIVEALLHQEGLLICDRYWREFHFPETLRRYLQRQLLTQEDAEVVALHKRAATWFSRRGLSHQALLHSISAGDQDSALELLNRLGSMAIGVQYGVPTLKRVLSALALSPETDDPTVPLGWAMIDVHEGRIAEAAQLVALVRSRVAEKPLTSARTLEELHLCEALLGAFVDRPAPVLAKLRAPVASSGESAQPDHGRLGLLHILLSWEAFAAGDLAGADAEIDRSELHYNESEAAYGTLFLHVHRCIIDYWRNDLDAALDEAIIAERVVHLFFATDERLVALTGILRQGLLFDRGHSGAALNLLDLLGVVAALEGWGEVQRWAHHYAATAAIHDGRFDVARGIYANGVEVAERLGLPRLAWTMKWAIVALESKAGRLDVAWQRAENIAHFDQLSWREHVEGFMTLAALRIRRGELDAVDAVLPNIEALLRGRGMRRLDAQFAVLQAHLALARDDVDAVRAHLQTARTLFPNTLSRASLLELGREIEPYARELQGWPIPMRAPTRLAMPTNPALRAEVLDASDPLTEREREIINHLREGTPNKITAFELGVSEATVKFHLRNIYRKLNARNRTQALARYRDLLTT